MKVEVVPYEPIHGVKIIERNVRERGIKPYSEWRTFAQGWKDGGPAYTLFIDSEIVLSAGIILLDWKRGEAWALLSGSFYRYKKTCFKLFREHLEKIVKAHKLIRIQAVIYPDFDAAKRFMEHLGFQEEGLMRAYGPSNENMIMYSRIFSHG